MKKIIRISLWFFTGIRVCAGWGHSDQTVWFFQDFLTVLERFCPVQSKNTFVSFRSFWDPEGLPLDPLGPWIGIKDQPLDLCRPIVYYLNANMKRELVSWSCLFKIASTDLIIILSVFVIEIISRSTAPRPPHQRSLELRVSPCSLPRSWSECKKHMFS